ncbi:MAG: hypothetical protein HQK96_14580 [Nitrospirae bacterium]|nr:hypothetical protein [Nitrospirota bacterium]
MVLNGVLLLTIFLLSACAVNGLNNKEAADEGKFPSREMSRLLIPLSNGDFEEAKESVCANTDNCKEHFSFPGWIFNGVGAVIDKGPGYKSNNSLQMTAALKNNDKIDPTLNNPYTLEYPTLNSITLNEPYTLEYPLDIKYLTKEITVGYQPDIFTGSPAKSTMFFRFFNKNGELLSTVTYVLNGEQDFMNYVNTVNDGVSYITYIKNDNKIGINNILKIDNLLKLQNEGASKISAQVLDIKEIDKVTVSFKVWYNFNGETKVTHRGWAKYIDKGDMSSGQYITNAAVFQRISIPKRWQSEQMNVSVSAWVWSDTPNSALLKIRSNMGKEAVSAFHSGDGTWEYLTVVYPFPEIIESFTLSFITVSGTSRLDNVSPIVIRDNRFDIVKNPLHKFFFRENVAYAKSNRFRIVIVGNSTIDGATARNGSIPYVLQSKLESLYPGKFEIINYGIKAWNLQSQIVALNRGFIFHLLGSEPLRPKELQALDKRFEKITLVKERRDAPTISELNPDIIVISSMWNDIREFYGVLGGHYLCFDIVDPGDCDEMPCIISYMKNLYRYMDIPTKSNFQTTSKMFERYMEISERDKRVDELKKLTFEEFKNSDYRRYLTINAEKYYSYLLSEFTERALRIAKVWQMTLPFKGGDNYLKYLKRAAIFTQLPISTDGDADDPTKKVYYTDKLVDDIQRKVGQEVSNRFNLPFIDLSHIINSEFSSLPVSEYINLGYFAFADKVHFTYRGNELLADRLFKNMQDEFERILSFTEK